MKTSLLVAAVVVVVTAMAVVKGANKQKKADGNVGINDYVEM